MPARLAPAFPTSIHRPFNAETCDVVVELKPEVVSFHFGLPEKSLVDRLKAAGCVILSSATTHLSHCARRRSPRALPTSPG